MTDQYEYVPNEPTGYEVPPATVTQKPKRNTAFLAVVSVVVALMLIFGGLTLWKQSREIPSPPLAVDVAALEAAFAKDKLATCDLGDEFWESVGVQDVEMIHSRCEGFIESVEGMRVPFTMSIKRDPTESTDFVPFEGTTNTWYHTTDPEQDQPGQLHAIGWGYRDGMECRARSEAEALSHVWLTVTGGTCEPLEAVAAQLDNIAEQYEHRPGEKGLFNFDVPQYAAVNPTPPRAVSRYYQMAASEALAPGERIDVPNEFFPGSTFTFTDLHHDGDHLVYRAEFGLGVGTTGDRQFFDVPKDFVAIYPDGYTIPLYPIELGSMPAGDTAVVENTSKYGEPDGEGILLYARNTDGTYAIWRF